MWIHITSHSSTVAGWYSILFPPKIIGFGFLSTALICQGESTTPELLEVFDEQMRVCGRLPKYQHALGSAGVDWQCPAARRGGGWGGRWADWRRLEFWAVAQGTAPCWLIRITPSFLTPLWHSTNTTKRQWLFCHCMVCILILTHSLLCLFLSCALSLSTHASDCASIQLVARAAPIQ